jgi:FtsZ-binding cell division protein ZapB
MVTLDQVKELDEKVTKAIDYVKKVTGENGRLKEENSRLTEKLDSCQKRIDELEVLVQKFKEEQGRIEDGILSALDRLNQFEDAVESAISAAKPAKPTAKPEAVKTEAVTTAAVRAAAVQPETPKTEDSGPPLEEDEDEALLDSGELDIF